MQTLVCSEGAPANSVDAQTAEDCAQDMTLVISLVNSVDPRHKKFVAGDACYNKIMGNGTVEAASPNFLSVNFEKGAPNVNFVLHSGAWFPAGSQLLKNDQLEEQAAFKEFDRVLVRNATYERWQPNHFSHVYGHLYCMIGGKTFSQCIKYIGQDLINKVG